jgi:hypothetical protein
VTVRRRRLATGLAALAVAVLASACLPPPPPPKPPVFDAACARTLVASTPGTVASDAIVEASGISASRRVDGVWWVHNDSGDTARVFAIGTAGQTLGEYTLSGATAVDWEDVAAGPGPSAGVPYLYVGDIGGNVTPRATVRVYRVAEPLVDPSRPLTVPQVLGGVDTLTLTYPDGTHDAEGLFVDPTTRDVFVVTKDLAGGVAGIYRAPPAAAGSSAIALSKVATVSLGSFQGVTGADITPAGDVIGLRTYLGVFLYPRAGGTSVASAFSQANCAGAAPPVGSGPGAEAQGEALGFTRDGRGYVTVSEGAHPPLHRFVAP